MSVQDICKQQAFSSWSFQILMIPAKFISTLILFNFEAVLTEEA